MTSTVSLPQARSKKQIWQTYISWVIFFLSKSASTTLPHAEMLPGWEGRGGTGSARGDTRENTPLSGFRLSWGG